MKKIESGTKFSSIDEILKPKFAGKKVKLRGWVHRQRSGKKIAFIVLRDGTDTLQCTAKKSELSEEMFENSVILNMNHQLSFLEHLKKMTELQMVMNSM